MILEKVWNRFFGNHYLGFSGHEFVALSSYQEDVMTKILVVSNDEQFSRMLNYTLTYNGFIVESAPTLDHAWKCLQEIHFDLLLLDYKFREGNGVDFCKELRHCGSGAALVVMGECYDEVSILHGMYTGMDDYILKPFGMSELKMLLNKQLERKRLMARPIVYGDLTIDMARSLVTVKDKILSLGKKEMDIMVILARKAGRIVWADKLLTEERIKALSKKLKNVAGEALQIRSISGVGYKLVSCV